MRKVLIIGYLWPYCSYPNGSPRTLGLANYLPEFGWQPIILTPSLSKKLNFSRFRVIETPYCSVVATLRKKLHLNPNKGFQEQLGIPLAYRENRDFFMTKLSMLVEEIITYPDVDKGWKSFAIHAGNELLEKEQIGTMISVWPITAHLVAKELREKHRLRWIADFTHLWSQGYDYQYGPIRKLFDRRLEIKTILQAGALTTVSPFFAKRLRELHKRQPIYSITHGFDPISVNSPPAPLTARFSITYTGTFVHTKKQKPSKLFEALKELIDNKIIDRNDIEVAFYGTEYEWLTRKVEQYGLSDIVRQYGVIPRSVSFQKQRESQVLLHLGWDDKGIKGCYSSKIFDYLAAQRPILAVGGASDEVVKNLLSETKAGVYCPDIKDIKEFIAQSYLEWKQKGRVTYAGDPVQTNKYSHREMARKFAEILEHLT